MAHRMGHADRIVGPGDARVEQHAVKAQLHGLTDVRGRPHARIDNHGIVGVVALERFENDGQAVGIQDALARADGRTGQHDTGRAGVLQTASHDRIVVRVHQNRKAVLDQGLGGLKGADRIGQQRFLVAEDLELDPVGHRETVPIEQLPAEPGHADRVGGREATGRVGQDRVPFRVDEVEDVASLSVQQSLLAHRDGDHVGARGDQGFTHLLEAGVLARAHEQAAREAVRADDQRFIERRRGVRLKGHGTHGVPPPTKVTISTRSPAARTTSS